MWADRLNQRQRKAIECLDNVGLIARPGTGKTRTLLAKAVQLVEDEVAPVNQLRIVNFTNAGVRDLRRKIRGEAQYGVLDADQATTFHSLALQALVRAAPKTLPRPLVILDDWEERNLLDRFVKLRLSLGSIRDARKLREDYNARWCQATEDVSQWFTEQRGAFESAYRQAQDCLQFVTRGELTFLWWRHLTANPGVAGIDASRLLVDEYQDLNECEHEILSMLGQAGVRVFAVGDPNQSIYESMRHAHPEFCNEFPNRVPPGQLHILDISYRCPRRVLEAGQAVMSGAIGVPDPSKAINEGDVQILACPTDGAELDAISKLMVHWTVREPESRVLVAVPSRAMAASLAKILGTLGVHVDDRTRREDSTNEACRYARALMNLLKNRHHSVAAATAAILKCAPSTRDARTVELLETAHRESKTVSDLLGSHGSLSGPLWKAVARVDQDLALLTEADDLLAAVAELTGCESIARDAADEELASEAEESGELTPGCVTIMTVHSCKGLEAETVFLPGVEPGLYERDTHGKALAERRRLFYVGLTRTRDRLIISFANRRYSSDRYKDPTGPSVQKGRSVFLDELVSGTSLRPQLPSAYLKRVLSG